MGILLLGSPASVANIEVIGTQISSGNDGRANLLLYPGALTNSNWQYFSTATVADAAGTGPDGSATASALTEGTANGNHEASIAFSKPASALSYMFGFVVKQALRTRVVMVASDNPPFHSNNSNIAFDIAGGQIGTSIVNVGTGFTGSNASITALGNGFYFCQVEVSISSAYTSASLTIQGDSGSGTQAISNTYTGNNTTPSFYIAGSFVAPKTATGNVLSNLIDGNPTTWWEDYSPQAWAGIDLGVGNTAQFTGYLFSPQEGNTTVASRDAFYDYPSQLNGQAQFNQPVKGVQTSNSATFASGVTPQDTLPTTRSFARYDLHRRDFSAVTSRCARMFSPYGHMSQLYFLARSGSTNNARPCRPAISPWGGIFPAGSTTVTIASETPFATIYYTTNGSTPTNASTIYTGPFTLSPSSATTLKAIAYDGTAALTQPTSAVSTAHFSSDKIKPKQDWYDTNGVLIEAHGGGLIQVGSFIYWVGFNWNMLGNTVLYSPAVPRQEYGVNLYRCTADQSNPGYLTQWTNLGQILPQPIQSGNTPWFACERPHIVFNANNNTFCLAVNTVSADFSVHHAAFASSSNIESGWSWVNQDFNPAGNGCADHGFYTNAANTIAYLVYTGSSGGNNVGMFISKMDSTFVTSVVATNTVDPTTTRESPILFDNGTNLFLITSVVDPYPAQDQADVQYCTVSGLDPIAPTWPSLRGGAVFATSPPSGGYFTSQSSFVFKPAGKSQYILGSDTWFTDGVNGYSSRQAWSPLTVTSTTITATQPASWNIGDLT